ncbi:SRP9/SRP21 family protein [Aspergillus foveolatus]|uniref:SRP9/SRP21 family protein n=1 Tax=Aspergillus foveolatus TaxID=210207 RepID=UPI003CCDD999
MRSGPYLPTSAAYLKESSLLLQAYPESTRITTKYTFPKSSPSSTKKSKPETTPSPQSASTPAAPIATLVLKTYNPEAGICLKYRTNKAAEVGRLITALGLLAGGADMASLDGPISATITGGDVEMGGTSGVGEEVVATAASTGANTGAGVGKGKGKGKKKGKK